MNIMAAANAAEVSLHDMTQSTPAVWFFYVIIGGLIAVIIYFIVRDRNDIAKSLSDLALEFKGFRKDLADNYATKHDLDRVEGIIVRHLDHHTPRVERRLVEDGEGEG